MSVKNVDLSLIKEKIIKTDEVIKLLAGKKQENQKNQAKYQVLLNLYAKKCEDDKLIQKKVKLLEKTIENHQSYAKRYRTLQTSYEELQNTHSKYANDIQLKYQSANKEITELRAELENKFLSQCTKLCNAKITKYENKVSKLEEKQKTQNDMIKNLGKENKTLIRKLKIAEQKQPVEKDRDQTNYEKLTSIMNERLRDNEATSNEYVQDLINDHAKELNLCKEKFVQSEKDYSILLLEKKLLQDEVQFLRTKLEHAKVQKNNSKFCDQSAQTEDFNGQNSCDKNNETFANDFNKSLKYQSNGFPFEEGDESSIESIDFIFRDHVLPKPISPLSMSPEFEEETVLQQYFKPVTIPAIEIIPPTPPAETVHEFENIFVIEKSESNKIETKPHVCKRCKIYKRKLLNEHKMLSSSKNKIIKLHKSNMRLKNSIKNFRMRFQLYQTKIKNSTKSCRPPLEPKVSNSCTITEENVYFEQTCKGPMCKSYYFCYDNTRPTSPAFIGFDVVKEHTETCCIDNESKNSDSRELKQLDSIENIRTISPDFIGFEKATSHDENITATFTQRIDEGAVVLNPEDGVEKSVTGQHDHLPTNSIRMQIIENRGDFDAENDLSKGLATGEKEVYKENAYSMIFKVFEKMVEYIDKKIDMCTNLNNNKNTIISPNEEQTFNQLLSKYNKNNVKRTGRRLSSSSDSLSSVAIKKQKRYTRIENNVDNIERVNTRTGSKQSLNSENNLQSNSSERFVHNSETSESDNFYESELTSLDSGYTSENRTASHSPVFKGFGDSSQNTGLILTNNASTSNEGNKLNPVVNKKKNPSKIQTLRQKLSNARFGKNSKSSNFDSVKKDKVVPNRKLPKIKQINDSLNETTIGSKRTRLSLKNKCCNEENTSIKNAPSQNNKKINGSIHITEDILKKRKEAARIFKSLSKLPAVIEETQEKTTYKRPSRRSKFIPCPRSPSPSFAKDEGNNKDKNSTNPKIIPLERPQKLTKEVANEILNKIINFPNEAQVLEQVVNKLYGQDDVYIAEIILRKLREDIHDKPDTKYTPPAPLLTPTQRTLLGLMMALEKRNVKVCENFLIKAEAKLLVETKVLRISPVLRIYLTICKLKNYKERMRRMCCDAVYFMGDLAVPFLFVVLTSWAEIIPMASASENMPMVRTLLKVITSKNFNKPGYNLSNLKNLIVQYYEYKDLDSDDKIFEDLFNKYKEVPSWSLQYEILLLCKYCDKSWVMKKLNKTIIPFLSAVTDAKLLMAIFSLVQKICQLFTEDCDGEYVHKIKDWISSLQKGISPSASSREN